MQSCSKTERVGQTAVKPRNVDIYSTFEPNLHFGKMNVIDSQNFSTRKCDSGIQTSAATCGVVKGVAVHAAVLVILGDLVMNLGPVAAAPVTPVPTALCYSSTVHRHRLSPLNSAARSINTHQKNTKKKTTSLQLNRKDCKKSNSVIIGNYGYIHFRYI